MRIVIIVSNEIANLLWILNAPEKSNRPKDKNEIPYKTIGEMVDATSEPDIKNVTKTMYPK
ncbi:hypothetical protein [uncultured Pedobacter sp.]|uniref:hypothetical protein n=1 Tax=uncultured Pedobacter sp. TaxID=246139 RepID=UPI0025D2463B|nr:hypothetical protein [uncultured Pedobacter sp.]